MTYCVLGVKSISSQKCLFSKIHYLINTRLIVKAMILPYFDYGDLIYYSATQEFALKLQRLLQRITYVSSNKVLRITFCSNTNEYINTKDLYSKANIVPLKMRRELHFLKLMYKRVNTTTESCEYNYTDARCLPTRQHIGPTLSHQASI